MRRNAIAACCGLALFMIGATAWAAGPVTLSSLLEEMTNLAALAESPDPPFVCKQFSSYDRKSRTPDDHAAWFANNDRGQYLRVEERDGRKEFVMLDAEGPGCVVRIWSANAEGDLRIYIDGAEQPAVEMNMQHALDGKHAPFLAPLAGVHSRGWNLYFPFPYAKHCRVTTTGGDIYYQVNYRTYPAGTPVESVSMAAIGAAAEKIETVRKALEKPFEANANPSAEEQAGFIELAPGSEESVVELYGPGAICQIEGQIRAGNLRDALRQTILTIYFDGQAEPGVRCPFGDFFGTSPDVNAYESLPIRVEKQGEGGKFAARWFMPFERSARIVLSNRGKEYISLEGALKSVAYSWTDRSMHFHAKWRAENKMAPRPFRDWTFVKAQGQGVFVGDMLSVVNDVKDWWGEGDEKIYVDGEAFPSHFGTGTEDYFGYAWCCPDLFTHAYHNQTRCDGPGNYGLTSVNRFHVLDKIPFTKQFQFDLEVWAWNEKNPVSFNATSYWYARPGATDDFAPPADERLVVVAPKPLPEPKRVQGAIEGETLKALEKTAVLETQKGFEELWSNGGQLWWRDGKPGEVLVLAFPVETAGRYKVIGNFTRAVDYGTVQLYINEQKAGEPIDLYDKEVTVTGRKELGTFDLTAGENRLKCEIVGKNEKAVPKYMFGVDYLLLERE